MSIDDLHPVGHFLTENPAAVFALLGVLLAGFINVVLQRGLFSSKTTMERNEKIRELLGALVAAVNARQAARETVAKRESAVSAWVAVNPAAALVGATGGKPNPEISAARLRVSEAKEALAHADSQVDNLFFQLSIVLRPSEDDAIFAAKGLMAAPSEDSSLYVNAYNLMLGVAGHHFSDDNKEHSKSAQQNISAYRPLLEADWTSYIAERAHGAAALQADRVG